MFSTPTFSISTTLDQCYLVLLPYLAPLVLVAPAGQHGHDVIRKAYPGLFMSIAAATLEASLKAANTPIFTASYGWFITIADAEAARVNIYRWAQSRQQPGAMGGPVISGHSVEKVRAALAKCESVVRGEIEPDGDLRRFEQLSWEGTVAGVPYKAVCYDTKGASQ